MPRAAPIQTSFNAGELSYSIEGRPDIAKYANGCKTLENYYPMIQGPAKRRGGTRFVAEVKDSTTRTWLIRFEFNVQQAYQVEIGHLYMRFYTQHGQVLSAGVPYEIVSPYSASDLTNSDGTFALKFTESNDVIYIAHQNYMVRKLQRLAPTSWQIVTMDPTNGPFKDKNTTATTMTCSAITGAITITASTAVFSASHVGSLIYIQQPLTSTTKQWESGKAVLINDIRRSNGINYKALAAGTTGTIKPTHFEGAVYDGDTGVQWQYQDPGYGYAKITAFTDTTHVNATVINQLPAQATSATTKWAFGSFSDVEGYPSQVNFYKERLVFGRGQGVWLSVSGDYENFADRDGNGNVVADMAISLTLQSDKVNNIQWMSSGDSLLCGTAGGEFAVQSITTNLPFGPDNVTAPSVSPFGSRNLQPARIGEATLFIQRSGIKMRDIVYDFMSNKFESRDNSILADHITAGGLTQLAFQQEPYSVVWAVRADGQLVAMTYSREQYHDAPFGGWHRHIIGGSYAGGNSVVECISSIPAPEGGRDELWMIVKRTINGVTKRYVEYINNERQYNDDPEDSFYVDSGSVVDRNAYNLVYAATSSTVNATACTLTPTTAVAGTTGVVFIAGFSIFSGGDVGRYIRYRYSAVDPLDGKTLIWLTSIAKITAFTDTTHVVVTIITAFPSASAIASTAWRTTTAVITGLGYLEGQSVKVLGDGAVYPPNTVTGGQITLDLPAGKCAIGLQNRSRLQTMRFNYGGGDGTSQGKTSRINKQTIRLFESGGVKCGSDFSNLSELPLRGTEDLMDAPVPLYTGDELIDFNADYSTNPWVCVEQTDPLPGSIICLMPIMSTQDRG